MSAGWRPLRRLKLYQGLGWGLIAGIVYLTLTSLPPAGPEVPYADKGGHLLAYGTLMLWWGSLAEAAVLRRRLLIAFVAMGGVLELLQGWGGIRHAEWPDFFANGLGAGLGHFFTSKIKGGLFGLLPKAF